MNLRSCSTTAITSRQNRLCGSQTFMARVEPAAVAEWSRKVPGGPNLLSLGGVSRPRRPLDLRHEFASVGDLFAGGPGYERGSVRQAPRIRRIFRYPEGRQRGLKLLLLLLLSFRRCGRLRGRCVFCCGHGDYDTHSSVGVRSGDGAHLRQWPYEG